jgi:hypothetical protein
VTQADVLVVEAEVRKEQDGAGHRAPPQTVRQGAGGEAARTTILLAALTPLPASLLQELLVLLLAHLLAPLLDDRRHA